MRYWSFLSTWQYLCVHGSSFWKEGMDVKPQNQRIQVDPWRYSVHACCLTVHHVEPSIISVFAPNVELIQSFVISAHES